MSIFIIILLVLGSIIALFFIAGLLIKKNFRVESKIVINKPKEQVFDYIRMIRNQEQYSVWVMKDPNVKIVYTGTDGVVGFTSAWESKDKNVGIGEQEITQLNEGESMEVEIRFKKPFEATNHATTTVTTTDKGSTKVVTTFFGHCKFPMNVMFVFMSRLLKKDMQQNLENLKAILEK